MSTIPQFASTPRAAGVSISTANTGRDGTGTLGTVIIAGNNGTRIDWVHTNAVNPTTAGNIRYFISGNGSQFLVNDIPVAAITPNTITGAWSYDLYPNSPILLPSGYNFRASTNNAELFHVTAFGGDF